MGAAGVVIWGIGRVFTQNQDPSKGETGMVVPQPEPELIGHTEWLKDKYWGELSGGTQAPT